MSVPLELRASSRWMAWVLIDGNKVPLNAKTGKGHAGYHDDPNAWSSFAQVSRRVPRPSSKRGWGLVVGAPFVVVDIDSCVINGEPDARAVGIIKEIPATYAELSPSGKGLHLWYRCTRHDELPGQAVGAFEAYARRRFMTVTGAQVSETDKVREITAAEALAIFKAANPAYDEGNRTYSDEEGYWSPMALEAMLKAWSESIPGFAFSSMAGKWAVPCPRHAQHTVKRAALTRDAQAWIENGWPVFNCFHAHCADLTFGGFKEYYDPVNAFFNFDRWQETELEKLDLL